MDEAWKRYQEEAAEFFRGLGMQAETDVTATGVRTDHDVDVLVIQRFVGFDIKWIVECKHWAVPVTKLHVLALRQIVTDVGADRGILLAEKGFQAGAYEAANLTSIHLTSLANLRVTASPEIYRMRVMELFDRVQSCYGRYWDLPKNHRIEHGLRPDSIGYGYSGDNVIKALDSLLKMAMRGVYPIELDELEHLAIKDSPISYTSVRDLVSSVEIILLELERKLESAENIPSKPNNLGF